MSWYKLLSLLLLFAVPVGRAFAVPPAPFLETGIDAQLSGSGGAGVAFASGASAVWYNPAGVAASEDVEILSSYRTLVAGVNSGYVGASIPVLANHGIGFGWNWTGAGGIEIVDDFGEVDNNQASVGLNCFCLTYGRHFALSKDNTGSDNDGLYLGMTGKGVLQYLGDYSNSGFGVDIGAQFRRGMFAAGIASRNTGGLTLKGKSYWDETVIPEVVPPNIVAGLGIRRLFEIKSSTRPSTERVNLTGREEIGKPYTHRLVAPPEGIRIPGAGAQTVTQVDERDKSQPAKGDEVFHVSASVMTDFGYNFGSHPSQRMWFSLGGDVIFEGLFVLRLGWHSIDHFSAGTGVEISSVALDYAFVQGQGLVSTHWVTLRWCI